MEAAVEEEVVGEGQGPAVGAELEAKVAILHRSHSHKRFSEQSRL